jgi:hypothetical protein
MYRLGRSILENQLSSVMDFTRVTYFLEKRKPGDKIFPRLPPSERGIPFFHLNIFSFQIQGDDCLG